MPVASTTRSASSVGLVAEQALGDRGREQAVAVALGHAGDLAAGEQAVGQFLHALVEVLQLARRAQVACRRPRVSMSGWSRWIAATCFSDAAQHSLEQ